MTMTNNQLLNALFENITTTTILTPNRRLSAILLKRFNHYQQAQGKLSWPTPDILPLSVWLQRLWQDYTCTQFTDTPHLLNAAQESFLWEKIILETKQAHQLLQIAETADIAKSAWALLKQWQIDIHQPIFQSAEDYLALKEWITLFEKTCHEKNCIDSHTMTGNITRLIAEQRIPLPPHLIMIGFTEIAPQLKALLKQAENTSRIHIIEYDKPDAPSFLKRTNLPDAQEEIQAMALWAKTLIQHQPNASIACVIPDLEKKRDQVLQIFSETLSPKNIYPTDTQHHLFNLSAGKALTQYSLINMALELLSLHKKVIQIETVSHLLSSPFIGEAEYERITRSQLDKALKQDNINRINLVDIGKNTDPASSLFTLYCPKLSKRLSAYFSYLHTLPNKLSYYEWANVFTESLTLLGWPGERSLNSEEYQVVDSWLTLFTQFASLDQISSPVSWQQALSTLQKMAAKSIFQPKTPEAPIQVLGLLEAAGSPFDYIWVSGMDDIAWPPQPKPNPLIPKRLQREMNMPHATAQRELMFCNNIMQQFKCNTDYLIFSYAEKNEEFDVEPSPLIKSLPIINIAELNIEDYYSPIERIYQTKNIEYLQDETAPAITLEEKIAGGVSILKHQALCPFKAFAEWRLHAKELETPTPGLRNKDRGNVIHKALELCWNQLQDQQMLLSADSNQLTELINESIKLALDQYAVSHKDHSNYLNLEKKRLHALLNDWLALEKERPAFKVLTHEKKMDVTLNQLTFSIRVDRIDELSDGKKLIIDYKTGKNSNINQWLSERPDEPQLPLYSLLDKDTTAGITFAQVATGEHCFKGVSGYEMGVKGIKEITEIKKVTASSWNEQMINWQTTLQSLSDQFAQGYALVQPKEADQTCLHCRLKPLCRINEEMTCQ